LTGAVRKNATLFSPEGTFGTGKNRLTLHDKSSSFFPLRNLSNRFTLTILKEKSQQEKNLFQGRFP
jgi:hypothetical protein